MSLGCESFLMHAFVLEAIYEISSANASATDAYAQQLYERFLDRLQAKKIPFLVFLDENSYQLELPMPQAYIFTVEDAGKMISAGAIDDTAVSNSTNHTGLPTIEHSAYGDSLPALNAHRGS